VKRRLYSLYPEQIAKLERLAKHSQMPQSEYLRELIDAEYVRKFPVTTKNVTN
jgi:predicted DNA-binding protein